MISAIVDWEPARLAGWKPKCPAPIVAMRAALAATAPARTPRPPPSPRRPRLNLLLPLPRTAASPGQPSHTASAPPDDDTPFSPPKQVRALRPRPTALKLAAVGAASAAVNAPLGVWREHCAKFSPQWFLAVHASIPFVISLRKAVVMPPYAARAPPPMPPPRRSRA